MSQMEENGSFEMEEDSANSEVGGFYPLHIAASHVDKHFGNS